MSKYLGLDLGTNSIGWALIDNDKIEKFGVRVFPGLAKTLDTKSSKFDKIKSVFYKLSKSIKRNSKQVILYSITLTMFSLTLVFPNNWQFWLNLGIGGLIATLTVSKN